MRIVVSGYYGFGNVGDEAVLAAIIKGLRQKDPLAEITVLSATPQLTAELNGVKSIGRYRWLSIIKALGRADVLISGGGTLFQDATSTHSFLYYIGIIVLAKLWRKKVVVFGQGFGPLRKITNRLIAELVLDRVDLITLRDEDSAQEFQQLGVRRPHTYATGDPTAILEPGDIREGRKILSLEGITFDRPLVGVALRSLPHAPEIEAELLRRLAHELDRLIDKHGVQPVFIFFQCPEDMRPASKVAELMVHRTNLVFRICRPDEMLALFPNFSLVIGLRLHSLIFAALNAVPLLGISYDPKVRSFLKAIDQPCLELSELDQMNSLLNQVLAGAKHIRRQLAGQRQSLRDKAARNFDLLFEAIK